MTTKIGPTGVAISDRVLLIGGAVVLVAVIGIAWWVKRQAGKAVDATVDTVKDAATYVRKDAINITSHDNVPTTLVNTIGQATGVFGTNDLTGQANTLGSALYEAGAWTSEKFGGLF